MHPLVVSVSNHEREVVAPLVLRGPQDERERARSTPQGVLDGDGGVLQARLHPTERERPYAASAAVCLAWAAWTTSAAAWSNESFAVLRHRS